MKIMRFGAVLTDRFLDTSCKEVLEREKGLGLFARVPENPEIPSDLRWLQVEALSGILRRP